MAAMAAAGWGFWPWIIARAEAQGSIHTAVLALFPLATMTVLSMPFAFRTPLPRTLVPWLSMVWLGLSDVANVLCFFSAYQKTTVAIAVLTHYLTPLLVALFAPMFTEERLEKRTIVAAAVSFAGLVLLLEPWRSSLRTQDLVGAGLGALSAFFYASNVIVQKRTGAIFSAAQFLFFHGLVAVPLLLARVPSGALHQLTPGSVAWLTGGSIVLGAACGALFLAGLRRIRASHASMLTLMEPLVAVGVGAVLLHQEIRVMTLIGGALVLVAAAWTVRA